MSIRTYWSSFWTGLMRRQAGVQYSTPSSGKLTTRSVTDETAMQLSIVFACVRRISQTIASLPLEFYRVERGSDGKIRRKVLVTDHPLYRLFRYKPNRYQDGIQFLETLGSQLAFWGNFYSRIDRGSNKEIISLLPLMSSQVEVVLNIDGSIFYRYNDGRKTTVYQEDEIWHLKLFGNGILGMSPFDCARNALGIQIGAEDRVGRMASNNFKQAGVLSIEKILNKDQREMIKKSFRDITSGDDDSLRVLEAGMKYTPTSMNPKDVQLLESRKFENEELCRFFDVPPVLIHDMASSTVWGSGITEIVRGWYKLGLSPYPARIISGIKTKLLNYDERDLIEPEFDSDELLRGGEKERYEGYDKGIRSGVLTPNEARAQEGLPPDPHGDELFIDRQLIFLRNGGMPNEQTQTASIGAN